jgi:hypothetical protein
MVILSAYAVFVVVTVEDVAAVKPHELFCVSAVTPVQYANPLWIALSEELFRSANEPVVVATVAVLIVSAAYIGVVCNVPDVLDAPPTIGLLL